MDMAKVTQDNELLSFVSIAAATANVVKYLSPDKQKNSESNDSADAGKSDEEKRRDHRAYVEQRLRELRAWERRIQDGAVRKRR